MFRDGGHPIHRILAQARAQTFHQLRRRIAAAGASQSGKDIERGGRQRLQGTGNQFHAFDRGPKLEPSQFLTQHIRQTAAFARDARQPRMHVGRGPRTMLELQPQGLHPGLTLPQKLRTAGDQRLERLFQISDILDLLLKIASRPKTRARHESAARRELPSQCNVEIPYRGGTQTARETRSRQTQQFTHARHTQGMQGLQPFGIPCRAGDRQPRQTPGQRCEVVDDDGADAGRIAGVRPAPRQPQRCQSRWCRGAVRLQRKPAPTGIDVGMQTLESTE